MVMYTQLTSWNNLLLAYQRAAKGKRGLPNVAAFEHDLELNLLQLQAFLFAVGSTTPATAIPGVCAAPSCVKLFYKQLSPRYKTAAI
ncbi:MAG: hypothetical protein KF770_11400 [Anaerolineae bacterium]|nr:hypothetical protein [Anaerolineae bacterium]